eukprot:UN22018
MFRWCWNFHKIKFVDFPYRRLQYPDLPNNRLVLLDNLPCNVILY